MQEGGTRPAVDFLKNGRKHSGKEGCSMLAARWISRRCCYRTSWQYELPIRRCQSGKASSAPSISPALLNRARALAAEHAQLTRDLNTEYDSQIAKKAGSLSAVTTALSGWEKANNVCLICYEPHNIIDERSSLYRSYNNSSKIPRLTRNYENWRQKSSRRLQNSYRYFRMIFRRVSSLNTLSQDFHASSNYGQELVEMKLHSLLGIYCGCIRPTASGMVYAQIC